MKSVIVILVLVTLVHGLRTRLLRQRLPARNHETFEGVIEQVGESVVAYRSAGPSPHQSVIAIHGFLEDFRYFTALYRDPSLELVLVNNSGYHCPVIGWPAARASWSEVDNPYPVGSIEHDAFVFNLALTHRVTGARVRAHGHSRGGAVILEAARQNPALFRDVEVILEAPADRRGALRRVRLCALESAQDRAVAWPVFRSPNLSGGPGQPGLDANMDRTPRFGPICPHPQRNHPDRRT